MRISTTLFAVTDSETSCLDPKVDELLEIGAVFCDSRGRVYDTFETLVRPTKPLAPDNSAIHGLIDEDFADAPDRRIALQRFDDKLLRWTRGHASEVRPVFVAHHFVFDAGFIPVLSELGGLCTKRAALHLCPEFPNAKNQTLRFAFRDVARRPDIRALGDAHRALGDAHVTAAILPHLLDRYLAAGHPDDIDALIDFANSPVKIERFAFGKYRGERIAEADPSYLRWMLRQADLDDDLRYSIESALQARQRVGAA